MKLPDWVLSPKCFLPLLAASIAISPYSEALAQVRVRGYTRKDGTYVKPHIRSSPRSYGGGSYVPPYQSSSPGSYGVKGRNDGGLGGRSQIQSPPTNDSNCELKLSQMSQIQRGEVVRVSGIVGPDPLQPGKFIYCSMVFNAVR